MAVVELVAEGDPLDARIVTANDACKRLVVEPGTTVIGRKLLDFTAPDRINIARQNVASLSARVDGYYVAGRAVPDNGREFSALYSVRRLHLDDAPNLAAITVLPEHLDTQPLEDTIAMTTTAAGFLVTDHEWRIEHRSDDLAAALLGETTASIGAPLLGSIHPHDAPDLILAIIQATASRRSAVIRVRLRAGDSAWRHTSGLVTALCDHDPPRLGAVFALAPRDIDLDRPARGSDLERRLQRMATVLRATDAIAGATQDINTDLDRALAGLSERQIEIVTRLVNGERVPQIAQMMYLSPSTVRNHLTAVFRKFRVHSQVELISLLKNLGDPSL